MSKQIVVLQRGWCVIGEVSKKGTEVTIKDANVIRRWGTTKGLGQLASEGPQPNTVLDPCPDVKVHELAIVFQMVTNPSAWDKK